MFFLSLILLLVLGPSLETVTMEELSLALRSWWAVFRKVTEGIQMRFFSASRRVFWKSCSCRSCRLILGSRHSSSRHCWVSNTPSTSGRTGFMWERKLV